MKKKITKQELSDENKRLQRKIKSLEKQLNGKGKTDTNDIANSDSVRYISFIADNIPTYIAYAESKTLKYLYVNKMFLKSFGIKRDEIIGKRIPDIIGKDNYKIASKHIREVRKGKRTFYINKFNIKEGVRWGEVHYIPDFDQDKKVKGIIVLTHDITEKKSIEDKLQQSEKKFKELIELAADGILLGSEEGIVIGANQYMQKLTGRSLKNLLGIHISKLFSPKELQNVPFRFDLLEKGKIVISRRTIITPDGLKVPIEMHTKKMPDGTYQAIFHDITERLKSEESLLENKEKFRALSEATSEAILISQNGKCLEQNLMARKMFGYSDKEIIGKELTDWIAPEYRKLVSKNIKDGFEEQYEIYVKKKNGTTFPALIHPRMMAYKGKKFRFTSIRDISKIKSTENELRKNQEFLTKAEQVAKFGNWSFQLNKGAVRASEGARLIYGLDNPFGTMKEVQGMVLNQYRPMLDKALSDLVKKSVPYDVEFKIRRKTDNKIIDIKSKAEFDASKNLVFGVVQDITEQKRAEEKLKEREKFLETLIENLPIMAFVKEAKNLTFVSINKAGEKLIGISREEMLGKSDFDFFPKHEADFFTSYDREVLNKKLMVDIPEETLKTVHKGTRILHTKKIPVLDDNGNPQYLLGISEDITARKKSEEQVNMLADALTSVNECVSITNLDEQLIFINKSFEKTYGFTQKEVLGKDMSLIRSDKTDPEIYRTINPATINGGWHGELWNKRKDGSEFPLELSTTVIRDSQNNPIGFIGVAADITERKKTENELLKAKELAERSNRLKTEFLAQMSHEIRTPISTMLNFVNLIQMQIQDILNEDLKQGFAIIDSASKRVIRTIDLILNMAEIQTGTYEYKPSQINLTKDILKNLHIEFYNIANEKGITFQIRNKTSKALVYADEYSTTQIFANLIDNAIKYTQSGKVEVIITELKNSLSVKVRDTGVGISKEYIPYLFEAFSQEEQGYTRRFEGNGLGLALVKEYCKMNNAAIKVTSKKGSGTTFTVLFNKK